jgi:hypothetical protein
VPMYAQRLLIQTTVMSKSGKLTILTSGWECRRWLLVVVRSDVQNAVDLCGFSAPRPHLKRVYLT